MTSKMRRIVMAMVCGLAGCGDATRDDPEPSCMSGVERIERACGDLMAAWATCWDELDCPDFDASACLDQCSEQHHFDIDECSMQCAEDNPDSQELWMQCLQYTCPEESGRVTRRREMCNDECWQQDAEANTCNDECEDFSEVVYACGLEQEAIDTPAWIFLMCEMDQGDYEDSVCEQVASECG